MGPDIGRPVDIDLLAQEPASQPAQDWANIAFLSLSVATVVIIIPMLWLLLAMRSNAGSLSQRLSVAQGTIGQLGTPPPELVSLRANAAAAQQQLAKLQADAATISEKHINWGPVVASIWALAGADVNVASIQTLDRRITLRGDAASLDAVSGYTDRLRQTGYYQNVVIEMVTTGGTPVPGPTPQPTLPVFPTPIILTPAAGTPAPIATPPLTTPGVYPSPTYYPGMATPTYYPGIATPVILPSPAPPGPPAPAPTYTRLPTYTPFPTYTPLPTLTHVPTSTPVPTAPPLPSPTAVMAVTLTGVSFTPNMLAPGGILRVQITVVNIGQTPLTSQNDPPPGYTYNEGQSSPPGQPGLWRVAADTTVYAAQQLMRYRWGFGGVLYPGQSRQVIGYVKLSTPGTQVYCAGIVREFMGWPIPCAGSTTVTVTSPSPTVPPTFTTAPMPMPTLTTGPSTCPDGYEVDDTWQQARVIGANTSMPQVHTFSKSGDQDWVKFAVTPGLTYTLRTQNLTNGADTMITLYGNQNGTLFQLVQNDEDPNNNLTNPPLAGPSRISYSFTPTQTATYGTTFYARVMSPNPSNFGCNKSYQLSLTSSSVLAPGVHFVRMEAPPAVIVPETGEKAQAGQSQAELLPANIPAAAPRVGFTVIMDLKGGAP